MEAPGKQDIKEFNAQTENMNMFRIVQIDEGITFNSQVLYRSQVHIQLQGGWDEFFRRFPRVQSVQGRSSVIYGMGDWQVIREA